MSEYIERLLKNAKVKELKKEANEKALSQELSLELEIGESSNEELSDAITEDEYSENYFNDATTVSSEFDEEDAEPENLIPKDKKINDKNKKKKSEKFKKKIGAKEVVVVPVEENNVITEDDLFDRITNPVSDETSYETPFSSVSEEPVAENLSAKSSFSEEIVAENLSDKSSFSEEPVAESLSDKSSFSEEPVAENLSAKSSFSEEIVAESLSDKSSFSEEPVAENLSAKSSFSEEPVAENFSAKSSFAEEPVAENLSAKSSFSESFDTQPVVEEHIDNFINSHFVEEYPVVENTVTKINEEKGNIYHPDAQIDLENILHEDDLKSVTSYYRTSDEKYMEVFEHQEAVILNNDSDFSYIQKQDAQDALFEKVTRNNNTDTEKITHNESQTSQFETESEDSLPNILQLSKNRITEEIESLKSSNEELLNNITQSGIITSNELKQCIAQNCVPEEILSNNTYSNTIKQINVQNEAINDLNGYLNNIQQLNNFDSESVAALNVYSAIYDISSNEDRLQTAKDIVQTSYDCQILSKGLTTVESNKQHIISEYAAANKLTEEYVAELFKTPSEADKSATETPAFNTALEKYNQCIKLLDTYSDAYTDISLNGHSTENLKYSNVIETIEYSNSIAVLNQHINSCNETVNKIIDDFSVKNKVSYEESKMHLLANDKDFINTTLEIANCKKIVDEIYSSKSVSENTKSLITGLSKKYFSNENHNTVNKDSTKISSTANTAPIEKKAVDKNVKFKEETLQSFKYVAQGTLNKAENVGKRIIEEAVETSFADDCSKDGIKTIKESVQTVSEVASFFGLKEIAQKAKREVDTFSKSGEIFDKYMQKTNWFTYADLHEIPAEDLKSKLKDVGLSSSQIKEIVKNKELIYQVNNIRTELLTRPNLLSSKELEYLKNGNLFNLSDKTTISILNKYYTNSTDELIRNVLGNGKFAGLSEKNYKKLLKKGKEFDISSNGLAAISLGKMFAKRKMAMQVLSSKTILSLRNGLKKLSQNVTSSDDTVALGMNDIQRLSKVLTVGGRFGTKVLIGTKRGGYSGLLTNSKPAKDIRKLAIKILIGTKKGGYNGLLTLTARTMIVKFKNELKTLDMGLLCLTHGKFSLSKSIYFLKNFSQLKINQANELIKKTGRAVTKSVNNTKKATVTNAKKLATKIGNKTGITAAKNKGTEAVRKFKQNEKVIKIRRNTKKARKTVSDTVSKTASVVKKPFKAVSNLYGKISDKLADFLSATNAIKRYILIAVCVIVIIYFFFMMFFINYLNSLISNKNTVFSTIVYDTDYLKTQMETLQSRYSERKDKAKEYLSGTPINSNGWGAHTLEAYGHPKPSTDKTETDKFGHSVVKKNDNNWIDGVKIYYTDGDGNPIPEGTNNIKDCLILAYLENCAEPGSDDVFTNSINNYYDFLNPNIFNAFGQLKSEYYKETSLYACETGCETIYYKCNDSATITNSNHTYMTNQSVLNNKNDGAKFYTDIVTHEHGDSYTTTCNGHYHGSKTMTVLIPNCDNQNTPTISGNSYSVTCAGHKGNWNCKTTEHTHKTDGDDACLELVCTNTSLFHTHSINNGCYKLQCTNTSKKHKHSEKCYCKKNLKEHTHQVWVSASNPGCYSTSYHNAVNGTITGPSGCDSYSIIQSGNSFLINCNGTGGKSHNHGTKNGIGDNAVAPSNSSGTCDNYRTEYFCNGHYATVCFGHKDIDVFIPVKDMQDAWDDNYFSSGIGLFAVWDEEHKDWCKTLYDQNWLEHYGLDPSLGTFGFVPGQELTDEQLKAILGNAENISELRKKIINSAVSSVGKVPYYYGGKPSGGTYPIMTNVGILNGPASRADHKGRLIAGLDCFGFCQWVYWNASGSNILPEGSMYSTGALFKSPAGIGNLKQINVSELQPGDLGCQDGHIGIFAGFNDKNEMMFIHCNGSANNVSYQPYKAFSKFYRLNGLD